MPLSSLLFGKPTTIQGGGAETVEIELDVTIGIVPSYSSTVTSYPVETGANIADHIYLDSVRLSMEGFITDSPVRYLSGVRNLISGAESRAKSAHDELLKLRASKTPFKIVTDLAVYSDMVFTKLDFPRDKSSGNALWFSAELQKLQIVSSKTVQIPADQVKDDPEGTADQAQSQVDAGTQVATAAEGAAGEKASLLFKTIKGIGLL